MKHCILAKYNDTVDEARKEALIEEIGEVFAPLLEMDGISQIEVIPNVIDRPNRYDILIRIDMDPTALEAYDSSEPHKNWKNNYGSLLEKKAIFDYE